MNKEEIFYVCGQHEFIVGGFRDTLRNTDSEVSIFVDKLLKKDDSAYYESAEGNLTDDYDEVDISFEIEEYEGDINVYVSLCEYSTSTSIDDWKNQEGDLKELIAEAFEDALDELIKMLLTIYFK